MSDDPGVLGNLPRSRPGRRSEKRAAPKGTNATTAKSTTRKTASGTRKATTRRKPAARKPAAPRRPAQPAPAPTAQSSDDPLTGAIKTAGALAEVGVKTAAKVAGGVLKRLPRP